MARPRSGSHLLLRGVTWYYRRVVPADARQAFGCSAVFVSLHTSHRVDAERLEKQHDVEFERRLRKTRDDANPETRRARIATDIIEAHPKIPHMAQWAVALLPEEDRDPVRAITNRHHTELTAYRDEVHGLAYEIEGLLPPTPLDPDVWQSCRADIMATVRYRIGLATQRPTIEAAPDLTLDWAFDRWLRLKNRPQQTVDEARRHLDELTGHAKLTFLGEVKRKHLIDWRDSLSDAGVLSPGSVNQRLQLVSAVLRAGWRDAEMPEPNLKALTVPEPDDSDRAAWTRDEILKALGNLEPNSWSAWVYLIGLTTAVRLGEPMAAQVNWYDPAGFIHIRRSDRSKTKASKLHALPIIECLRAPLAAYVAGRQEGYLFDGPRPNNPKLKVSHEASKWFGRFFDRLQIDRVFHELRDTWIEEARHSPIEKDIWEIISGHSRLTVSDRYGGKKPEVLAAANEKVCEFLTGDAEIKAAMLGLVC